MKKIENWDNIEVEEFNENEKFILGGKECRIVNVKNYAYNGIEKISLELDVIEEENKGYFQKKFDARGENAKFWDKGATISFVAEPTEDKDKSYIKGLIKAIESYNDGYTWNWDEQTLKDKKINANFSLAEYEGNDGNIYTKPNVSKFVNSKDNFRKDYIPNVQTLHNGYVKYEEYKQNKNNNSNDITDVFGSDTITIDENFLD